MDWLKVASKVFGRYSWNKQGDVSFFHGLQSNVVTLWQSNPSNLAARKTSTSRWPFSAGHMCFTRGRQLLGIPYIHPTFVPTWETYQDSNFDDVEVHHALRGMIGGLGLLASRIICYFSKCNVFIIIKPRQMNLLGQLFRKGPTFWGPKTRVLRMFQPCSRTTFMGLMNPHLLGGFLVGALLRRLLRRFSQAPPLWARAARNLSRSNRAWKSYESYDPAIQLGYVGPVRNCPGLCWNMFFSGGRTFVENWWTSWIFPFLFHIGNLIAVVGSSWCQQKRWILQVLPANSGIQATEMSIL